MARPSFFAFTAHSGVTRLPFPCVPSVSPSHPVRVLSVFPPYPIAFITL